MGKHFFRYFLYPVAMLSGSMIGVGFLSLPYITTKVGMGLMPLYFIAITAFITVIHVMFGEVALRTPDFKRFPGFVEHYLGKWPKKITLISMACGLFAILLVYIIIGSQLLAAILMPIVGGNALIWAIVYFLTASLVLYYGVRLVSRIEFWALCALLLILLILVWRGFSQIHPSSIFCAPIFGLDWKTAFLPYGALMFSLWGTGLIPDVEEMLPKGGSWSTEKGKRRRVLFKHIIITATVVTALIYFAFVLLVVGITGGNTTQSALVGLAEAIGDGLAPVVLFIGVITTFTAFTTQGLLLKEVLMYDLEWKEISAWAAVCGIPLIIFLTGFRSFIPLLSFVGGVLLSIDGIFILLMYRKIGGKKILIYPLMIFFIVAIAYSMVFFVS